MNYPPSITPEDYGTQLSNAERLAAYKKFIWRMCRAMLVGFKVTHERDVKFMDTCMNQLVDVMTQNDELEILYRNYLVYISTFDPAEGKKRLLELEEDLGYYALTVYAAAHVAKMLHKGQVDKAGKDYFDGHLMAVGCMGTTWKEQVVGFLHDAEEDTGTPVETSIKMVKDIIYDKAKRTTDRTWIDELEGKIYPYPGTSIFFPSDEDWQEVAEALRLLNHHTAASREEYIERITTNKLAAKVKLNDLTNNMDISRIAHPTEKDFERLKRYEKEYEKIKNERVRLVD